MRLKSIVAAIALCVPAILCTSADAQGVWQKVAPAKQAVAQAKPTSKPNIAEGGHYYYRAQNGQWFVWASGQWIRSQPLEARSQASVERAPVVISSYRTSAIVTYPDDDSDNTYFGIDWYRNGRGPFSD